MTTTDYVERIREALELAKKDRAFEDAAPSSYVMRKGMRAPSLYDLIPDIESLLSDHVALTRQPSEGEVSDTIIAHTARWGSGYGDISDAINDLANLARRLNALTRQVEDEEVKRLKRIHEIAVTPVGEFDVAGQNVRLRALMQFRGIR